MKMTLRSLSQNFDFAKINFDPEIFFHFREGFSLLSSPKIPFKGTQNFGELDI
jgi:hypothetical protein